MRRCAYESPSVVRLSSDLYEFSLSAQAPAWKGLVSDQRKKKERKKNRRRNAYPGKICMVRLDMQIHQVEYNSIR